MMAEPVILEGGQSVDGRGKVGFVNPFQFDGVKRFYMVENHRTGFIRAWHGHQREAKYVLAVSGSVIVAAVEIDNWERPSKDLPIHSYVLSAEKPTILHIPAGYANGFMNLTADAKLVFFSTSSLEESLTDDVRYDAHYWDAWTVMER